VPPVAPDVLVAAALDIAAAFRRGGRLLAAGEGRAATDARHIAVEFLHPVIVGKPSLAAVVGTGARTADDVVVGVAYRGSSIEEAVDIAIADHPVDDARHVIHLPDDPFAAKEAALTSYHVLWELVHVFLDASAGDGPAPDGGLGELYPMLYGGEVDEATVAAAVASTAEKLAETAALRESSLAGNADAIEVAAGIVAGAGTVFTFGNGGSATDAADLAWALGRRGWSLADDIATVTALANDVGFDVVFTRQLTTLARPGDAVVALSTSGTSRNVLNALEEAQRLGLGTIGLAGYDGGTMAAMGLDACCVVHSSSVHRIQESYVTVYNEIVRRATSAATTA
jgi:D-sedoheptulose 7-phosphate isomerase